MPVYNMDQIHECLSLQFSVSAYYLKSEVLKHYCIVSCFMESVSQIEFFLANSPQIFLRFVQQT